MEALNIYDTAKVMPKGQLTIPKEIRDIMGVKPGSRVAFVVEGKSVRLVNPAVYAMEYMQKQMREYANSMSDEEIMSMVKELRGEYNGK
ncbi:MAG: AbrB/MazE/SpoVT family DNA-binding domain-containing protein [Acidaminococcaceae bacterium]|nr:AbrB/MazE/SpoVT family DNA-binding domain-containing protein [Acidaminococcaceae bacterium]